MTEWQPIDTAPKDETMILVTIHFDDGSFHLHDIVWWNPYTNFWESAGYDWQRVKYDDDHNITHWMPLPAPPKKGGE